MQLLDNRAFRRQARDEFGSRTSVGRRMSRSEGNRGVVEVTLVYLLLCKTFSYHFSSRIDNDRQSRDLPKTIKVRDNS